MVRRKKGEGLRILAVSGGPDSTYLLYTMHRKNIPLLLAHVDYGMRGSDSRKDREFVGRLGKMLDVPVHILKPRKRRILDRPPSGTASGGRGGAFGSAFEEKSRAIRREYLLGLKEKTGAAEIVLGHTADDQVETVLMRLLEGGGISGLKGIPRSTPDGVERPLLDVWRKDILEYLRKHGISFRVDRSNSDTRFERNWIRHVLVPLLEERYGKKIKNRIYTLGERFREIDEFLGFSARRWMKRHLIYGSRAAGGGTGGRPSGNGIRRNAVEMRRAGQPEGKGGRNRRKTEEILFSREPYRGLPAVLRKKILQLVCYERIGIAPNERLLESMDRQIVSRRSSGRLSIGRETILRYRYGDASFLLPKPGEEKGDSPERAGKAPEPGRPILARMNGPGQYETGVGAAEGGTQADHPDIIRWEEGRNISPARLRRMGEGGLAAAFDADEIAAPLTVRPLRTGDRIRPFGLDAQKKVKEILIDRKMPRDERWGRPVVCDSTGEILWIPGVARSSHAPVTPRTKRTVVLRAGTREDPPP